MWESQPLLRLVNRYITAIYMSDDRLTFDTDQGPISFEVEGDCCSHSYFFDFYGVENLLSNGRVVRTEAVDLQPSDPGYHNPDIDDDYDVIKVYGYRLTTEHPEFGEVSSVFSFRNSSNGYYGGWMEYVEGGPTDFQVRLTADKIG